MGQISKRARQRMKNQQWGYKFSESLVGFNVGDRVIHRDWGGRVGTIENLFVDRKGLRGATVVMCRPTRVFETGLLYLTKLEGLDGKA